jgi:hypothetical protein
MNRATTIAESPASAPEVVVAVIDPDGLVLGDRPLKPGTKHAVPRDVAGRWIAEGRAIGESRFRYVSLGLIAVDGVVRDRGEVFETTESAPTYILESKRVIQLGPDEEPPDPLPPDPLGDPEWQKGPKVPVRTTRAVANLAPGVHARGAGEEHQLRERDALFHEHQGAVEILGSLSPVGEKAQAEYRAGRPLVDYEAMARRAREAGGRPGAPPPTVLVAAQEGRMYGGKYRRANDTFRMLESEAIPGLQSGELELRQEPSPRLRKVLNESRRGAGPR